MRKILLLVIILLIFGFYLSREKPVSVELEEVSIYIFPETILQGDPVLIVVNGTTSIKSLKFNGEEIPTFIHNNKPSALVGIDLRAPTGNYDIELELRDVQHSVLHKEVIVGERVIAKAPLGIPETLGGNTPESEKNLISTLVEEGAIISAVQSLNEKFWEGEFRFPIDGLVVVTDNYGYTRLTGGSSISHKGTDFRAAVGTPVYAANAGRVAYVDYLRNYGNTVIIDHGFGLLTIYMHLSEVDVKLGDKVNKGELIAKSGQTGYVLGPHLHLTVRINGISIDPMKFMALVGKETSER